MKKEMRIYSEEQVHFLQDGIQLKSGREDRRERSLLVNKLANGGKEFLIVDDGGASTLDDSYIQNHEVYAVAD